MAELRCPMCSKANPDTREVCQFCGARLRPLVLPMTGELNLPEDWIKAPPPAEKPAAPAQPAQGGDDWLGTLRNSGAANNESESFESAGAGNPVDDWLAKLRAQDEAEEAEAQSTPPPPSLPTSNWLNNPGSAEETFVHRPQSKPTPDPALPSWLQVNDDDEAAPNFAPAPAADSTPEPALPDWLSGGNAPEPAAPALPDWMSGSPDDTFAAPPPAAPAPKDELPAWLSGGSTEPAPEPELPSWMSGAPDDTFAAPPPTAAPASKDELPAWLSGGSSEPAPIPERPSWMTEEAPPPPSESALPDWLSSSTSAADETFVRPPKETKPEPSSSLPEWLSASGNEIDDTISSQPPEGAFTGADKEPSADLPDWLAGAQPATPDWLSAASGISDDTISLSDEPSYSPNQGTSGNDPDQSADLPDWLTASSESPAAAQPPAAKPGSSPLPDWLSEPVAKKPGSSSLRPRSSKPATPEIPDWLASSADETNVASAPAKPASQQPPADKVPGRAVEGITDWLSGDSSAQMPGGAKPAAWAPAEPEGGPRPLSTTGWLRSLSPTESSADNLDWLSTPPSPSEPSAPPAQPGKAVLGSTNWFASTEGSAAPSGDISDWLSPSAPAPAAPATPAPSTPASSAPPAGSAPPAPKDKAVVGSTDWFASTNGAPSSGVDIPDWLSASAPASAPASTPAPTPPPAPSTPKADKALVGSTDWLAENQGAASNVGDIPDWLAPNAPPRSSAPPPPAQKDKAVVGSTDWFASTEGAGTPSADMPDWLKGPTPASSAPANAGFGTTDWLTSLGSDPVPGAPEPPSATPVKKVKTGWLTGPLKASATADQPSAPAPAPKAILGATDWLDSLAAAAPTSGTGPLGKPKATTDTELPDWLGGPVPSPTGTSELPDWVADSPSPSGVASAPQVDNSSGKSVVGTTDWLKSLAAQPDKNAAPAAFVDTGMLADIRKNDVSDLDWLSALQPASPSAAPSAQRPLGTGPLKARPKLGEQPPAGAEAEPAQSSGDLPAWLAALKPTGIEIPRSSTMDTDATLVSHAPVSSTAEPASEADLPDWMRPAPGQAAPLQAPVPTRQPVRAQPAPAQASSAPFSAEETMVSARSLPGLSAAQSAQPSVPAFNTPVSGDGQEMITANLPAWMQALRPLDARATAREPEPDHEETAGPLAGMRGVLPAESVITMAGKPGVSVMGFVLTDAHTRLADRLRRLVQEEASDEGEIKPRKSLGINFDVWRLVVALALFAMVFLPFFQSIVPPDLQAQLFAPPPVSSAVQQFSEVVDKLQPKQIAVVAVEYEPGNRGEMDPAVASVLAHLLQKHVRVAVVSTSPTGAGVADELVRTAALEVGGLAIGKDYINLGFIPGGPAGLRQFALSPFATVHNDFSGNAISTTDWADLASLQKVGLVVVASSSADGVQNWLQQVQPQLAVSPPFTAISSAAAEPLVWPYTQGKPAQLAGVVTGLAGAIQYNTVSKRAPTYTAATTARWFSFGFGLYAIAGVLVLGSLISVLSLVLSRRPAPVKAGVKTKTRPAARTAAPVREPEPEPFAEEEAPPESPAVSDSWDPTETVLAKPAPKPSPKASATKASAAQPSKSAPAKKAPAATKTTATKGKASTAAGKAKPKAKSKSVETRVETESAVKAKPRMRKV